MQTIVLPIGIGEKVYILKRNSYDEDYSISEETVGAVKIDENNEVTFRTIETSYVVLKTKDEGKTFFVDKKEAETKLKEYPAIIKKAFIDVEINFFTDGDYRLNDFDKLGFEENGTGYEFKKTFARKDLESVQMEVRDFFEEVVTSLHFGSSKYYLMNSFYEMYDGAIHALYKEGVFYDSLGGNYEGTDISFEIREEV